MDWELVGWSLVLVIVAIVWLEIRGLRDDDDWPGGMA